MFGALPPVCAMARLKTSDTRGAVYVEFIIAFMPIFVLLLAICQFSLLVVARLVVSHAAVSAARSAIVVLEDDPKYYNNVPRGTISSNGGNRQGPRMATIRSAATEPLKVLAPGLGALIKSGQSVATALTPMSLTQSVSSELYTGLATLVTLHDSPTSDDPAQEPIDPDAAVTARVIYFYQCEVPLVRGLICRSLTRLTSGKWSWLRAPISRALGSHNFGDRLFMRITARATLPNQGAQYYHGGG
jgi:Flp pilus assembly protein TadG